MSALNATDIVTILNTTTESTANIDYGDYYQFNSDETFADRLRENWYQLPSYVLGMIMCTYVAYLSLFNKNITGDYKWFVLNQAIANFIQALGYFLENFVIGICVGPGQLLQYFIANNVPLWLTLYMEIVEQQLIAKFGVYAQMITLFATVFNRWMAIVLSDHYPTFMTRRLIFLYCLLCYLIVLPIDSHIFAILHSSFTLNNILLIAPFLIPWLLSVILNFSIWFKLWKHKNGVSGSMDARRLKEHRNVLLAITIQTVIPLFDKAPRYLFNIVNFFTNINGFSSINTNLAFLDQILNFNGYFTNVYTCLIILITLKPYREAVLSRISPLLKLCGCCMKPRTEETQVVSIKQAQTTSPNDRV